MRRWVVAFVWIAAAAIASGRQAKSDPTPAAPATVVDASRGSSAGDAALREALVAREKESWEAWKGRNGKFFQDFLSDDHVELGFGGPADKATVVAGVASPVCVVRSYAVDRFRFTLLDPNTALLTYHAEQDTTCGGKAVPSPVWASSLYVRRGGKWWNALYQQTQTTQK